MTGATQPAAEHGIPVIRFLPRLLPSIADFAFLFPVIFLFGRMNGAGTLLGDGDTGWHIRTGEWMLANGRVPRQDLFSFTRAGNDWYAWEWLSDVLMGWLHAHAGMQAVLLGAILLLCLTFGLLYRLIYRQCSSVLIAFVLTAVAAGGSSIHWLARPHLFTMLFLVIFCSVLEAGKIRWLFILPLISVLWTNLHGGFLFGILLVGAYAAGEALTALTAPERTIRRFAWVRCQGYSLTALGCFAASFVNPYTWRLHVHLVRFLTNPAYFQNIAEFLSISFRHPLAPFFEIMLLLGIASGFWNIMRRRFVSALLLTAGAHLALLSVRNIPLFMIVAAPLVGQSLSEWLESAGEKTRGSLAGRLFSGLDSLSLKLNAADAGPHWHIAGPAALLLLAALIYRPAPAPLLSSEYNRQLYPAAAIDVLSTQDRIFTTDTWGGYLIYRRYPAKVFVDGRSDFYGPDFESECYDILGVRHNWEARLREYRVDTVLLPVETPLSGTLKDSRNWRVSFDDGVAIVFRAVTRSPLIPEFMPAVTTHETESQQIAPPGMLLFRPFPSKPQ